MPVNFNHVAHDQELFDTTTSDMVRQTQRNVPCSEVSVSAAIPYESGMEQSSDTALEQITGELKAISCQKIKETEEPSFCQDIVKNDGSLMRLSSSTPEQVSSERETTCCPDIKDEIVSNLDIVKTDIFNDNAMMPKLKQKAEPLQQLKITPRNVTSNDSFNIKSVCELRHSMSHKEQDSCCDEKDKDREDGCFEQPLPPGTPPAITGFRRIKSVEPKLIQQVGGYIGRGSFGSVFKVHDQDTGTLLAIKRVPFTKDGKDKVMEEVHIMNRLRHPNIITMLGSQVLEMECHIFLEWMAGGSVQELLSQFGPMSARVIKSYSAQVLLGFAYLHQLEILHCDVKGANIVVDSTGQVAKLCDFGEAVKMPLPEGMKTKGTVPFMAPELFQNGCNSRGSDIWSVGCTMLQMATGNAPWSEFQHFGDLCVQYKICLEELPIPPSLPLLLREVIADCLQKDVAKRPTAHKLQCRLAMPFLEDISASPYLHDYLQPESV